VKTIRFYFKGGGISSNVEEFVEYPDDTTDEEIFKDLSAWLWETSEANWLEVREV